MRAIILLAAATLMLAACDQSPEAVAPAATPAPASVLPAPPPAAPAPVVAAVHRRHHRDAWQGERAGAESSYSHVSESYAESGVTDYGYVSDSRSYGGGARGADRRNGYGLWVDGFGRPHDSDDHAREAGTMTRGRRKPWAYYDGDWDR
ncbi:MAG TPA: hypothetical protein VMH86_17010 [Rhizomicrobium sp.]|nr:hypothetical protein [Rhizomicrobium sp.]